MKPGITLALIASVILVGGATWARYSPSSKQATLVKLDKNGEEIVYQNLFLDSLETASSTPEAPLNSTDLVTRQLLTDYIELATSGQASEENINQLAEQYVESLPNISVTAAIAYNDIKTVPDSQLNLSFYATKLTQIHENYKNKINSSSANQRSISGVNDASLNAASLVSQAYEEAAIELKNMEVPTSLVLQHYQLVNSYFSSAVAMEAVANANNDSTKAFVGLVKVNQNIEEEEVLLEEIGQILTSRGI